MYTVRSNAHLIVTTDCTLSITACSKSKDADLEKYGATNIHLIAAHKILSLDYLHEIWTMASMETTLRAIDKCEHY